MARAGNRLVKMGGTVRRARLRAAVGALKSDRRARAEALLYGSFALNLCYGLLQAVIGVAARSPWAGALAFYHMTLSAIRFSLLHGHKRADSLQKWRKYRASALVMLVLDIALLGIHGVTLYTGHIITYPGYMIYAMAAYTFYAAIAAVRNVVIYRRYNDPVLSAAKALSLAVAAISVYSLQAAMIPAFGDSERFRVVMGSCVGAGVFLLISTLAVCMIVRGTRAIRRAGREQP